MRLRTETSNHPKVKKFLDSVPYLMVRLSPSSPPFCIQNRLTELHFPFHRT